MIEALRALAPLLGPLLVALLTGLGAFFRNRSPINRIRNRTINLAQVREQLPETLRWPIDAELEESVRELRSESHYLRVRRIDGANLATVIFFALVAGAAIVGAIAVSTTWAWVVAIIIVLVCVLFEVVGAPQTYVVPHDDDVSPARAKRMEPRND